MASSVSSSRSEPEPSKLPPSVEKELKELHAEWEGKRIQQLHDSIGIGMLKPQLVAATRRDLKADVERLEKLQSNAATQELTQKLFFAYNGLMKDFRKFALLGSEEARRTSGLSALIGKEHAQAINDCYNEVFKIEPFEEEGDDIFEEPPPPPTVEERKNGS